MTRTAAAAATGLPTDRRTVLSQLAALPLIGGVASAGKAELSSSDLAERVSATGEQPDADQPMTAEDYAAAEFAAVEVDLKALRSAFEDRWTPLAIAALVMSKNSAETAEVVAGLDKDSNGKLVITTIEQFQRASAWYKQTAALIEAAEIRFMCGAHRAFIESGGNFDAPDGGTANEVAA